MDLTFSWRWPEQIGCEENEGGHRVYLIITMIKWIRTRRLSIKNSLSVLQIEVRNHAVCAYGCEAVGIWALRAPKEARL